jgi:hypothetical protein
MSSARIAEGSDRSHPRSPRLFSGDPRGNSQTSWRQWNAPSHRRPGGRAALPDDSRQVISGAIASDGVIDLFQAAGLPDQNVGPSRRGIGPHRGRGRLLRRPVRQCLRPGGDAGRHAASDRARTGRPDQGQSSLDWTQRETVRADLRRTVRRLLTKYGYPPDAQESATQLVIRQAELMAEGIVSK